MSRTPLSRADLVAALGVATLLVAMGGLMLAHPGAAVSADPGGYAPVSGTLASVRTLGARKVARVEFTLAGDPREFVTHAVPDSEARSGWVVGHTIVAFHVDRASPVATAGPVETFGLRADGRGRRTVQQDIDERNLIATPWGALFAIALGVGASLLTLFQWRRQNAG